ncbi:hypothetical protein PG993_001553 [Apiospora rasikravindrae]|uniref:Uncharacterized protein n=1 Tax=Apiospora rasikravindrae TaxID=990691 RepID=A0ABR1UBR0_9PEZI
MSTYISRIISLRDVDERHTNPIKGGKRYTLASPIMDDDTDSSDADDEYSSDDEFLLVSSATDAENEYQNGTDNTDDTDSTSSLEIIEDYFDRMLLSLDTPCQCYICEKNGESQEVDPPVLRLKLPSNYSEAIKEEAMTDPEGRHITQECTLVGCEDSIPLRNGEIASQQTDEECDHDDDADNWSTASSCLSDSWALEIEAAEEDRIAREEEDLAVAKTRGKPQQGAEYPLPSTRGNRHRKVAFALRPQIIGE